MTDHSRFIELSGLDGSNPLAFLASLGVLRCVELASTDALPRLAWTDQLRPVFDPGTPLSHSAFVEVVFRSVKQILEDGAASLGDIIGVPVAEFRKFADPMTADPRQSRDRTRLLFASAFASDAVIDARKGTVIPTVLSFSNGQGGKLLLKDFRTLVGHLTAERVRSALFQQWRYSDCDEPTFRWDPLDMRTGAHMATDPGSTQTSSVMAANALAFLGLSFLTTVPTDCSLQTTAFHRVDGDLHFVWPIWRDPIDVDIVKSLLQLHSAQEERGIIARFASRRIMFKKNLYLGASFAL